MFGGDEVSAIVMDMGHSCTKSGYAGEDCPKFVIPSSVGVIGGEEAAAQETKSKRQFFVGTNALAVRPRVQSWHGRPGSLAVAVWSTGLFACRRRTRHVCIEC